MRLDNIGEYRNVDAFVAGKLRSFDQMGHTMVGLYRLMFSERDNVMYERSIGYRIEKLTYGQVYNRTEAMAFRLSGLLSTVPAGACVGLYMENSLTWLETFWSILRAGYRPLLLNCRLDMDTLNGAIADCDCAAVLTDKFVSEGSPFRVPTLCPPETDGVSGERLDENAPMGDCIMLMSSGTSRNVKVCEYGAEELYWQIQNSRHFIKTSSRIKEHYDGQLKLLTLLPFYHIFGLLAVYIWFCFFSRTLVELENLTPDVVLGTVRRHKVTHIFAVPLFWTCVYDAAMDKIRHTGSDRTEQLKTAAKFERALAFSQKLDAMPAISAAFKRIAFRQVRDGMFGDSIRFLITGGGEIKPSVLTFFNGVGYHLANGYGLTEVGITSVELSDSCRVLNSGSVGLPAPSVEYVVNESSELLIRGRSCARRIITRGEELPTGQDSLYNTHDLVKCEKGRYYILGRCDDLVVSPSGENLNPALTEPYFDGMDGILGVALVAHRREGVVTPTLIFSVDKSLDHAALIELKTRISVRLHDCPTGSMISGIFLTRSRLLEPDEIKFNRKRIAEKYARGEYENAMTADPVGTLSDDACTRMIVRVFSQILNIPQERMSDTFDFFADGGGSSLDAFAMLEQIGRESGVLLSPADMGKLCTVRDIKAYIELNASPSQASQTTGTGLDKT